MGQQTSGKWVGLQSKLGESPEGWGGCELNSVCGKNSNIDSEMDRSGQKSTQTPVRQCSAVQHQNNLCVQDSEQLRHSRCISKTQTNAHKLNMVMKRTKLKLAKGFLRPSNFSRRRRVCKSAVETLPVHLRHQMWYILKTILSFEFCVIQWNTCQSQFYFMKALQISLLFCNVFLSLSLWNSELLSLISRTGSELL